MYCRYVPIPNPSESVRKKISCNVAISRQNILAVLAKKVAKFRNNSGISPLFCYFDANLLFASCDYFLVAISAISYITNHWQWFSSNFLDQSSTGGSPFLIQWEWGFHSLTSMWCLFFRPITERLISPCFSQWEWSFYLLTPEKRNI